ncbi:MAG TPA: manganese efflux pump, partial [Ruminococcaceae bacterium]|nr:manganese efflux pump [Oscillospiraceae bacterium]
KRGIARQAFVTALFFGLFQGIMPFIGWLLGIGLSDKIKAVDHWVAFVLLAFIGGKMIFEAIRNKNDAPECEPDNPVNERISVKTLLLLSVATSIDALAVGVSFAFVGSGEWGGILLACGIIASVTFLISSAGFFAGKKFGSLFKKHAELLGGGILLIIGGKILIEHLWFS